MGNRGTGINMSRDDGLGRSLHSTGVIGIGIAICIRIGLSEYWY